MNSSLVSFHGGLAIAFLQEYKSECFAVKLQTLQQLGALTTTSCIIGTPAVMNIVMQSNEYTSLRERFRVSRTLEMYTSVYSV